MKVRSRKTGEIIEVSVHGDTFIDEENGKSFYYDEVDVIDEPDWQQVRIQAAIAAMQGMMSDVDAIKTIFDHGKEQPITNRQEAFELVAEYAVNVTDALIAKLKKGGEL